jgi:hypothetical protein
MVAHRSVLCRGGGDPYLSLCASAFFNSLGQPAANRKVKSSLNEFKLMMIDVSLVVGGAIKRHKLWAHSSWLNNSFK